MEDILKELMSELELVTKLKVNNVDILEFDSDFLSLVLNYAEYDDKQNKIYFNLYLAGKCTNLKTLAEYIQTHQDIETNLPFDYTDTNRKGYKDLTLCKYVVLVNPEDVEVSSAVHLKRYKLVLEIF